MNEKKMCSINKMSWCEGVYHKVSVEEESMKYTMTGLHKIFDGGRRMV